VIRVRGLRKDYPGGPRALDGIDLHVARGEFVALIGSSGAGKSTLLHLLGVDHKKLTYRFNGRDMRLTDVYGVPIPQIVA
jgi:putative ABC transport system ATP-binding protein